MTSFFHKKIMTIYANLCHGVLLRIMFRLFLFWFSLFLRSSCFARSCDCVTDWLRTLDSFMEYSISNYGVQTLIRQRTSFPHEQNQCGVSIAFFRNLKSYIAITSRLVPELCCEVSPKGYVQLCHLLQQKCRSC